MRELRPLTGAGSLRPLTGAGSLRPLTGAGSLTQRAALRQRAELFPTRLREWNRQGSSLLRIA
jgi:hypothetical protein